MRMAGTNFKTVAISGKGRRGMRHGKEDFNCVINASLLGTKTEVKVKCYDLIKLNSRYRFPLLYT